MAFSGDSRPKDLPKEELAMQVALTPAASKPDDVLFDAKEASLSPAIFAVQRGIRAEMRKKPRLHAWLNAQREIANESRIKASPSSAVTLGRHERRAKGRRRKINGPVHLNARNARLRHQSHSTMKIISVAMSGGCSAYRALDSQISSRQTFVCRRHCSTVQKSAQ